MIVEYVDMFKYQNWDDEVYKCGFKKMFSDKNDIPGWNKQAVSLCNLLKFEFLSK